MSERLGRYILERRLAMGGMAEVFLAKQAGPERFERQCIVKRMLDPLAADPQFVEMFLDEARLAAQLSHPNIAPIFDFGEEGGTYFIAMEYVPGSDLRTVIQAHEARGQTMPLPAAIRITAQAASALDYAHSALGNDGAPLKIVHRDVSPPNILLGTSGVVKLIDFGIAKAAGDRHQTTAGVIKGKMAYMSPEQVLGTALDGRSDIFSLGLVLFELLTNRQAINGETHMEFFEAIVKKPLPSARQFRDDLPDALEQILERMIQRDQGRRYPNAAMLNADLERLLTTLGVTVTPSDLARLLPKGPPAPVPAAKERVAVQITKPDARRPHLDEEGWEPTVASGRPALTPAPAARPAEAQRPAASLERRRKEVAALKADPDEPTLVPEPPHPDPTLPKHLMEVVEEGPDAARTQSAGSAERPTVETQTITERVRRSRWWVGLAILILLAGVVAFESQNPRVQAQVRSWLASFRGP